MRLIDADKLIQSICNTADLGGWIGDTLLQIKKLAIKYINSAPSIDICFCRECRYGEYRADFDDYECHYSGCGLVYNADDFCSYGEVSEKPTGSEKPNNSERSE